MKPFMVCFFLLLGCPPLPKPQHYDLGPPADLAVHIDVPACPASMTLPVTTDLCGGENGDLFTVEGYRCVRCEVGGCVDKTDSVYCVLDSCSDKRCGKPPLTLHRSKLAKGKK